MPKLTDLQDVLTDLVRDLYSAETQAAKFLPKLAKAAAAADLKDAFARHADQTKAQVERLDRVAEALAIKAKGKKCLAMEGLIKEAADLLAADGQPAAKDAALIAAAQRMEHYEIAGYGSAATYAKLLQEDEAADLLRQTLDEEKAADQQLTQVAEASPNPAAADDADEPPAPAPKPKPAKPAAAKKDKEAKEVKEKEKTAPAAPAAKKPAAKKAKS